MRMKKPVLVVIGSMLVLAVGLSWALAIAAAQPAPTQQVKNAYYPFSIEMDVGDR